MATLKSSFQSSSTNTPRKTLPILILVLAIITAGLIALATWYAPLPVVQRLSYDTIVEPLVGAERAVIELDVGAGHLHLQAGSSEQMLEGRVQTLTGTENLERTTTPQGNAMVYRLDAHAPLASGEPARWPEWNLNVNPDIPLELNIRGGRGESVLDLSRLNVSTFKLTTGAGSYTVTFPRIGNVKAEVIGGLSPTRLLIPKNVAVKLEVIRGGQGHVEFDGNVFSQKSSFVSEHYDAAENQLELRLTSGLSHVFIETVL
jgi:hypothetical protein